MKNIGNHKLIMRNQKGIALVVVLVLSAIGLALMTTLIYMITSGTQVSGMQKRYKTALEASMGGKDVVLQVVSLKDGTRDDIEAYLAQLRAAGIGAEQSAATDACVGTDREGTSHIGIMAKLKTTLAASSPEYCKSLTIIPDDNNTWDLRFELGTNPRYTVYAKIVSTVEGGPVDSDSKLSKPRDVDSKDGDIPGASNPNLYTIEMQTANNADSQEKAKLQVLYLY